MSFESLVKQASATVTSRDYERRYDGDLMLQQVGVAIPPSVRKLEVVVNWPRLAVDTTAEVLTVDGFESSTVGQESLDLVWRTWQSSRMPVASHLAHVEALTQGIAYALVGVDERGQVRTTVRSGDNVAVEYSSDGRVLSAVILYDTDSGHGSTVTQAAYYVPGRIEVFQSLNGVWMQVSSQRTADVVPLVPLINKHRINDVAGRSEMDLVIPFGDAASRSFTLLQLATELLSMPQRWIAGGELSRFKRPDGSKPTPTELYLGAFLTAPESDAKFGQFQGAQLDQVLAVLEHCAVMVSTMTGIPPSMLGVKTANPESAEAMRVAKERLIARGELKQGLFGDAWEEWARVVLAFSGVALGDSESLTTVWRDIAIPSNSAKSAYMLQAHAQGVLSARTARESLPLSPDQRARENVADLESVGLGSPSRVWSLKE